MKSLRGKILVASPKLTDPNFYHTVVLVIEHSAEGALGLVLNRPTPKTLQDVWEEVTGESCESTEPLNLGGPVPGPLMALHGVEQASQVEILPGVHFSADQSSLSRIATEMDSPFRIFTGYAGWGSGQLEKELASNDWLVAPATFEYVFHNEEDLWKKIVGDLAYSTIFAPLRVRHSPPDPATN